MVINTENVCTETLEEIFRQSFFEVDVDCDSDLLIRDTFACFISNCGESIRIAAEFTLKKSSSRAQRLDLCNRINCACEVLRATHMPKRRLIIDWFLPIRGGLSASTLVQAFRAFNGRTQNALIQLDKDNIVE